MVTRFLSIALFGMALGLTGCASQQLGRTATLTNPDQYSPVQVSATFQPRICSGHFGYITFSLANQSSDWVRFQNPRLAFNGQPHEQSIRVVMGEDLAAWEDSRVLMLNRDQYNENVMTLVATATGLAMLMSDDERVQTAGAGALIMAEGNNIKNNLSDHYNHARNPISLEPEKHILTGTLNVPPSMDRQYWVLLNNSADAHLLTELTLSLTDQHGNDYEYRVPINNWQSCDWQKERKDKLKRWAYETGYFERRFDRSAGTMTERVTKNMAELDELYRKKQSN